MVEEFVWIILSPRGHIHLHQASTWADQLIVVVAGVEVEVVEAVAAADVEILTMTEDMIVGTTDMRTMITGTEEDLLLLIIADTDHDQDRVPTAQDAIDNRMVAVKDFFPSNFSFFFFLSQFPQASHLSYSLKKVFDFLMYTFLSVILLFSTPLL